jgi:hypothetical protein
MSLGLVFVTAPKSDYKLISLLFMHLRDWEFAGLRSSSDNFRLVTSKNAYDLDVPARPLRSGTQETGETSPPLSSSLDNAWAGAALEDVEAFCLDLARNDDSGGTGRYNYSLYVVVDSTDLQAHTCILGERAVDREAAEFTRLDRFNKMRVPWDLVYATFCNLDIANMSFEEFTREFHDGGGGDGKNSWYTYKDVSGGVNLSEEDRRRRDREVERFKDAGHI